ncbi:MAG: queuosine precursor transporter, partial [Spirochaetota bacterium]
RAARRVVVIGFGAIVGFTLIMQLALFFAPAESDFAHDSLRTIFGILPRIAAASLLAYLVPQLHDVWAYALWKRLAPAENKIWIRNNASTLVSQLIDSIIFVVVAFLGVFSLGVLLEVLLTTYVLKVIVAAADTPFVYWATRWVRNDVIRESAAVSEDRII